MMSRPLVLGFLLLVLIITSQFEWKQQLVNDLDSNHSISEKQQQTMNKEEVIKEKSDRQDIQNASVAKGQRFFFRYDRGDSISSLAVGIPHLPPPETCDLFIFMPSWSAATLALNFDYSQTLFLEIILSQEKNIQRLNKLVQSLQQQLLQCQGINKTVNSNDSSLMTNINEIERQHTVED